MSLPQSAFIRSRFLIFAAVIAVTLFGGALILRSFSIDNSVGVWFAHDDPALAEYEQYLERFGHSEWTLLMVETESVKAPRFLRDLQELTARLEGLKHVHRVVSLVNAPGMAGTAPTPHAALTSPRSAAALIRQLEESPMTGGLLLRPGDRRHTVLLLQTENQLRRQDPYRMALVDEIHAAVVETPTITDHCLAGTTVINAELNRSARSDMFVFFTAVTVLVFIISLLLFRSLKNAVVLLSVAGSTVISTMALIVACGYSFNMVTIMLPTVLIALSVADAIHVIHSFHEVRNIHGAARAVGSTIRKVWLPCVGTSVSTMVGFLSLASSSVLPIFQLALFGAFGIALACLVSLTAAPLLLYQLWHTDSEGACRISAHQPRYLRPLIGWLRRRPGTIALAFAVASGGLAGLWQLEADTNYAEFFRSGAQVPSDYGKIDQAGFPQNPLVVTVAAPAEDRQLTPELWAALHTFASELRALPEVKHVLTASPQVQPAGMVSRDHRQIQLVLMTKYLSSRDLHRLTEEVRRLERETLPQRASLSVTGSTVLWASMDTQVIRTQLASAVIVSIAILIVLMAVFRSLSLALVGWVASAFPVALILGVMGLLGVTINMATVLIAGIALGIAVDDTIHFVFAFRERFRRGARPQSAVEQALFEIGPRLVVTSVMLIGGFGSMVLSDFVPTASFGLFACLTILVALVTDLFLLPVILRRWGRAWQKRRAGTATRKTRTVSPAPLVVTTGGLLEHVADRYSRWRR